MVLGISPPPIPIAGAPDCPNPQWTEAIQDLAFTSATLTVQLPPGTSVLTLSCTFSPATSTDEWPLRALAVSKSIVPPRERPRRLARRGRGLVLPAADADPASAQGNQEITWPEKNN